MSRSKSIRSQLDFMKGNMTILTIRQVVGMFFRRMVLSYASLFVLAVGGDENQIGIINSVRPLAGLIIFPIAGYLTDRINRVKMIAIADLLTGITMFLYVLAPSWEWIAVASLVQGFMVFAFPPTSAIIADSLEPSSRGVGISVMNGLANGVSMFSSYIAAVVLVIYGDNTGMRILYAFLGLQAIFCAYLVYSRMEEPRETIHTEPMPNILMILKDTYSGLPELWRNMSLSIKALSGLVLMGFIVNGVTSPFWVVYVTEEIGLTTIEWGLILLYESILKVLLTVPAGVFADKLGRSKTLLISTVISLISLPALIFANDFRAVLLIRLGAAIAGASFIPASSALMADYTPRNIRGKVMAAVGRGTVLVGATGGGTGGPGMGFLFVIPVMISSLLGGALYALNSDYPWYLVAVASLVQLVLVLFYIRDPEQAEE
ncbi:MAG: MFS transporter [Candidatus Bathyarchaeota archaeon]|nr:MFS transporter [Candidatus Bathyarchaeota archaeon]